MRLADALLGVQQIGLDTPPVIYFVEQNPLYFQKMLVVMQKIARGDLEAVGSTLLLTEVLVQPFKVGNLSLASDYERILSHSVNFRLEALTPVFARRAAELRAQYQLRTPDAIHLATAIETGCQAFLTNDGDLRRVREIPVLYLEVLTL